MNVSKMHKSFFMNYIRANFGNSLHNSVLKSVKLLLVFYFLTLGPRFESRYCVNRRLCVVCQRIIS